MPCSREGIRKFGIAFLITNILLIGIGTGFIIAGTLSVIEVPSLESDNTKPLLDPVLSDPFQAGGMAFGLSILIITIGVVILGVAGLGIFLISGKWFQIKRMLAILDCCGVDPVLSMTNDFDQTPWCTTSGSCQTSRSNIPRTCCTGVDESTYSSAPASCHRNVTSGTYNAKGCYEALKEKLLSQSLSFICLAIATFVIETATVIIAFVIYLCFGDNETEGYRDKCCGIFFGDITMQIQGDLPLQRQRDVTVEKGGVRLGITNVDG
uniref:Tetraspanin n=1 Tax=Magallana gigas TaxID=29159 RepID=A0A8W8KQ19_MAGGI